MSNFNGLRRHLRSRCPLKPLAVFALVLKPSLRGRRRDPRDARGLPWGRAAPRGSDRPVVSFRAPEKPKTAQTKQFISPNETNRSRREKQVLEIIKARDSAISPNCLFSMGSGSFRFAVFLQVLFPAKSSVHGRRGALLICGHYNSDFCNREEFASFFDFEITAISLTALAIRRGRDRRTCAGPQA